MSYWVRLESDGTTVKVLSHAEGGTFSLGGTDEAELNVTYNYGDIYADYGFSLRDLDGKRARDVAPIMAAIVLNCGTQRHRDYWAATAGNAGHALAILYAWAMANPDAIFRVS